MSNREIADSVRLLEHWIYKRADNMALDVLHALETWVQIANDPQAPAQQAARDQLIRWADVMEQARALRSRVTIARKLPGGNNGNPGRS